MNETGVSLRSGAFPLKQSPVSGGVCFVVPPRKDRQIYMSQGLPFIKITVTDY